MGGHRAAGDRQGGGRRWFLTPRSQQELSSYGAWELQKFLSLIESYNFRRIYWEAKHAWLERGTFWKEKSPGWKWGANRASANPERLGERAVACLGGEGRGRSPEHRVLRELCSLPGREDAQLNARDWRLSVNSKSKHWKQPLATSK